MGRKGSEKMSGVNEIYIEPAPNPVVIHNPTLRPLAEIRDEKTLEILIKGHSAGTEMLMASYSLMSYVKELGNDADLPTLIEDYPALEGLLNMKGDISAQIESMLEFLNKLAEALGLENYKNFGTFYENEAAQME